MKMFEVFFKLRLLNLTFIKQILKNIFYKTIFYIRKKNEYLLYE